jgi:hypothetical protein
MTAVFAKHLGGGGFHSGGRRGGGFHRRRFGPGLAAGAVVGSFFSGGYYGGGYGAPAITTIRMSIWATARLSSMMVVVPSGSSRTIPVWNLSRVFEASLTT